MMLLYENTLRTVCDYCTDNYNDSIIKYNDKDLCLECAILEGVEI